VYRLQRPVSDIEATVAPQLEKEGWLDITDHDGRKNRMLAKSFGSGPVERAVIIFGRYLDPKQEKEFGPNGEIFLNLVMR
jgi:hypothetical protein